MNYADGNAEQEANTASIQQEPVQSSEANPGSIEKKANKNKDLPGVPKQEQKSKAQKVNYHDIPSTLRLPTKMLQLNAGELLPELPHSNINNSYHYDLVRKKALNFQMSSIRSKKKSVAQASTRQPLNESGLVQTNVLKLEHHHDKSRKGFRPSPSTIEYRAMYKGSNKNPYAIKKITNKFLPNSSTMKSSLN